MKRKIFPLRFFSGQKPPDSEDKREDSAYRIGGAFYTIIYWLLLDLVGGAFYTIIYILAIT